MRLLLGSLLLGCTLFGCGEPSSQYHARLEQTAPEPVFEVAEGAGAPTQVPATSEGPSREKSDRKIIFVAEVELIVKDFSAIEGRVPGLVEEHGGYLADAAIDRTQGRSRSGRWVARVPVERFEHFVEKLAGVGVPVRREQTAQDVTAEYIDLEARIANKQRLEERLLQLLEERSGKLSEIIEVEGELARVREEIETMQGRLRYMANRAALATVTILAREDDRFVPATAPTFTERIADAWKDSLGALRRFGEAAVIVAVTVAPWLVLLVPALVWYIFGRRRRVARA